MIFCLSLGTPVRDSSCALKRAGGAEVSAVTSYCSFCHFTVRRIIVLRGRYAAHPLFLPWPCFPLGVAASTKYAVSHQCVMKYELIRSRILPRAAHPKYFNDLRRSAFT